MDTRKERLFSSPLGKEVGNYLILNLARAFAGDHMKRITFGLGSSNTGKGILTKACQLSMGRTENRNDSRDPRERGNYCEGETSKEDSKKGNKH